MTTEYLIGIVSSHQHFVMQQLQKKAGMLAQLKTELNVAKPTNKSVLDAVPKAQEEKYMEKLIIRTTSFWVTEIEEREVAKLPSSERKKFDLTPEYEKNHTINRLYEYPEAIFYGMKTQQELFDFLYDENVKGTIEQFDMPESLKNLEPLSDEIVNQCKKREYADNFENDVELFYAYRGLKRDKEIETN